MRVLQVIDTLNVGGAERIVVLLSNLLFNRGIDVAVVLLVEDGELIEELNPNIPIYRLERKKRFDTSKMKELAKVIKEYDIIHTHLKHNYRYAQIVNLRYGLECNIIFQDHSHTLNISGISLKYFKDSFFKNILQPKYYIGVSDSNCNWAKNYLKIDEEFVFTLENVIIKEEVKKSNISCNKIILVSNISPIKNLEFAIDLVKNLDEEVVIYGKIIDISYYKKLQEIIRVNNLEEKISFITNCSKIQQEIPKYKFALHTSIRETGPLVLIEYLAQSLPFLSTSTGQVYNQIKNDVPQFFINNYNIEEWKRKLTHLNEVSKSKMEEVFERDFSTDNYIEKCLTIYKKVLNF